MDPLVLVIGYFMVIFLAIGGFLLYRRKWAADNEDGAHGVPAVAAVAAVAADQQHQQQQQPLQRGGAMARMRRGMAAAQRRAAAAEVAEPAPDGGGEPDGSDNEQGAGDDNDDGGAGGRGGRKAQLKAEKKREKEVARLARQTRDETRKKKNEEYDEARRRRDAEREEAERKKEEEEQQRLEAERKKEEAEFDEWKDLISVEESGSAEADASEGDGLLDQFVDHIRRAKIISVDDLADAFRLRASDVVSRIEALEASGRLTGIMDSERGKFIFIAPEDMEAVAKWMAHKGRVSLEELTKAANRLIDLTPSRNEATRLQMAAEDPSAVAAAPRESESQSARAAASNG